MLSGKLFGQLTMSVIFNQFLSTQNVNVARVARNEWDFFFDFQTLCVASKAAKEKMANDVI